MSLTGYIRDRNSPISKFLRTQFPNDRSFLADARKQVRQAETIRPVADVRWDIVAMTLDYRIRYYFDVTSYHKMVAYEGARRITDARSGALTGELAYHWTGSDSDWINIFDKSTGRVIWNYSPDLSSGRGSGNLSEEINSRAYELAARVAHGEVDSQDCSDLPLKSEFKNFFNDLRRLTEDNSPTERKLPTSLEDELNRRCVGFS